MGEEEGEAALRWIGAGFLLAPYAFFVLPYAGYYFEEFYHGEDFLELTKFRRQWVPILASLIILAPCIILLVSEDLHSTAVVWKTFAVYAWILLPMLVTMWRPLAKFPLDSIDVLTVALIIVPIIVNFYTFVLPDVQVKIKDGWPRISMLQITAINVGLVVFVGVRPLHDLGYNLDFGVRDIPRVTFGFILAAGMTLAIGYGTGNIDGWSYVPVAEGVGKYFVYLALVSLPQELLFRGVIQNLLHARFDSSVEVAKYTKFWADHLPGQPQAVGLSELDPMIPGMKPKAARDTEKKGLDSDRKLPEVKEETDPENPPEDEHDDKHEHDHENHKKIAEAFNVPAKYQTYDQAHAAWFDRNPLCWLWIPTLRDWVAVVLGAAIYAVALTDHTKWGEGNAETFGYIICLGFACGYTWRLTSKVTASAIVNSLILFIGLNVLNVDISLSLRWNKSCSSCVP